MTAPVSHSHFASARAQDPRPLAEIWRDAMERERAWVEARAAECLTAIAQARTAHPFFDCNPRQAKLGTLRSALASDSFGTGRDALEHFDRWTELDTLRDRASPELNPFEMLARLVALHEAACELAGQFSRIEHFCRKRADAQAR